MTRPLLLALSLTLAGCASGAAALPIALKALAAVSALGADLARSEIGGCPEGPSTLDGGVIPAAADAGGQ
jgi:hypothetical protein